MKQKASLSLRITRTEDNQTLRVTLFVCIQRISEPRTCSLQEWPTASIHSDQLFSVGVTHLRHDPACTPIYGNDPFPTEGSAAQFIACTLFYLFHIAATSICYRRTVFEVCSWWYSVFVPKKIEIFTIVPSLFCGILIVKHCFFVCVQEHAASFKLLHVTVASETSCYSTASKCVEINVTIEER